MRKVYLDHGATTPVRPEVAEVMQRCLTTYFGNPSSVHSFGREAKKALEEARDKIAGLIGANPDEIIFTSGGTEADNMALVGVSRAYQKKGKHVIVSSIEHHAVLDSAKYLEKQGFEVTYLPVNPEGLVMVEDVAEAIRKDTVLISVMHVNNEVGTLQPIADIGRLAREHGVLFHSDAVQSAGKIPVSVKELQVDMMALSSHKIYGPKGVGCLYIRKGVRMEPLLHGGGQERKRRPGTENLPGIAGFGEAAYWALKELDDEAVRLTFLRDRLIQGVLEMVPDVRLNGHPTIRVPGNANVSVLYVEGESMLLSLDMRGVAASSGSACTSGSLDPSHVLLAMGLPHEVAHGSLRMTMGRETTEDDIEYVLDILPPIVERLRDMSPLYLKEKEGELVGRVQ